MYFRVKNFYSTKKIVNFFLIISFFTVSFDIFLVLDVGPNIRIFQFLILFPIAYSFLLGLYKPLIIPLGFRPLLIWFIFIVLFIPNSGFISKGIGYAMWLLLNILLIFSLVQIITLKNVNRLFFWYLTSFFFVATFGLLQFLFALIGYGDLFLIKTWWIQNIFPRINGFSYEPSFFITYLIAGWAIIGYLIKNRINLFNRKLLKFYFLIITLAILLSGSRLGWFSIFFVVSAFYLNFFFKLIFLKSVKLGYMYLGILYLLFTCILALIFFHDYFSILTSGFSGSGTSINTRLDSTLNTFIVFFDSPIVGYSLGGVSSAIAKLNNLSVTDFTSAKIEGNMVLLEVLAASGAIGFLPFLFYLWNVFKKPFVIISNNKTNDFAVILIGITLATLIQFILLQFNQNILRPYFWLNLGILSALYNLYLKQNKL